MSQIPRGNFPLETWCTDQKLQEKVNQHLQTASLQTHAEMVESNDFNDFFTQKMFKLKICVMKMELPQIPNIYYMYIFL